MFGHRVAASNILVLLLQGSVHNDVYPPDSSFVVELEVIAAE